MDAQTRVFDATPSEIFVRILHNCDYVSIVRFSLTCKRAYEVVSSSISLQLHIELDINGLEIANQTSEKSLNYSSVLKELRDYQDAWLNLRLSPVVRQSVGTPMSRLQNWELRSNTYCGEFSSGSEHDGVSTYGTQTAVLGSPNLPAPAKYGKKCDFCIMDPRQDLAVLVEYKRMEPGRARLHLRSATTGKPHPLAENPILAVNFDDDFLCENKLLYEIMSTDPKVVGNHLVVKFNWYDSDRNVCEILLLNWRAGILLARISLEYNSAYYTFIDKDHLVVFSALPDSDHQSAHRLALLIYHIPNMPLGEMISLDANFHPGAYPRCCPTLIFELPELDPSWSIVPHPFTLGLDPLPEDVVYANTVSLLCSRVTTLSLKFRIRNTSYKHPYVDEPPKESPIEFHVLVSTYHLFLHLPKYLPKSEATRTIPWHQWNTATRWFIIEDPTEACTFEIYTSQCLRFTATDSGEGQHVAIVDFNGPRIKRHARSISAMPSGASAEIAPNLVVLQGKGLSASYLFQPRKDSNNLPIPAEGQALNQQVSTEMIGSDLKTIVRTGFKDPVISCLPYRTVTKIQRMPPHDHWHMHGKYLVGIQIMGDWPDSNKTFLSLYKLETPSQDQPDSDGCSSALVPMKS